MIGVGFAERPELVRRARIFKTASRIQIRQNHDFFRAEDLGRIRHELHTAKRDDIGIGGRRLARQFQRIAHEIGQILNFRLLVVMRQNDRVAFLAQAVNLRAQV